MATVTRQTLRTGLGREKGWLRQEPGAPLTASGTTSGVGAADGTTLVDTGLYSSALDQLVKRRSVICITSGARRGDRRYATGPVSTAGAVTVSPAFGAQIAGAVTYEIWEPDAPHPDIIDRLADKALGEDCWRWLQTPVTYIPYGDFGEELAVSGSNLVDGATVAWAGTNATPTLPSLVPPNEYVRRVLRITATAAGGYLQSQSIDVDPDNRPNWWIHALCRAQGAGAAGGDARIVLRDLTNAVDITPQETLQWTRRGWGLIESSFTIPATCNQIACRLVTQNNTEATDWAWVQGWPLGQRRFDVPRRVASADHAGKLFYREGAVFDEFRRRPYRGTIERRDPGGTGVQLELGTAPGGRSLWFYEKRGFPALTSATPAAADDDNTTWAAEPWLRSALAWECYRYLADRDRASSGQAQEWRQAENKAAEELMAMQREYGAEPMVAEDATVPHGLAVVRVG